MSMCDVLGVLERELSVTGAEDATPTVAARASGNVTTIVVRDLSSPEACARLSEAVLRALDQRADTIVVDLRATELIDMDGVHVLLLAHLRASDASAALWLVPAAPMAQRAIDAVHGPFDYIAGFEVASSSRRD